MLLSETVRRYDTEEKMRFCVAATIHFFKRNTQIVPAIFLQVLLVPEMFWSGIISVIPFAF